MMNKAQQDPAVSLFSSQPGGFNRSVLGQEDPTLVETIERLKYKIAAQKTENEKLQSMITELANAEKGLTPMLEKLTHEKKLAEEEKNRLEKELMKLKAELEKKTDNLQSNQLITTINF